MKPPGRLARKALLKQSVGLARKAPLKRSGRLKPVGKKAKRHDANLAESRPIVFARSGGRCEMGDHPDCTGRAEHLHHRLMRSQGTDDTPENLIYVCTPGHRYIHNNPSESYERGWLLHSPPTRGTT